MLNLPLQQALQQQRVHHATAKEHQELKIQTFGTQNGVGANLQLLRSTIITTIQRMKNASKKTSAKMDKNSIGVSKNVEIKMNRTNVGANKVVDVKMNRTNVMVSKNVEIKMNRTNVGANKNMQVNLLVLVINSMVILIF